MIKCDNGLNCPVEILLVEDSPSDVELTKQALMFGEIPHNLHCVEDGVEAMAFLRSERQCHDEPRPDLTLLDLNMPQKDGWEVLNELRQDKSLKTIPVIILPTSSLARDVLRSYELNAN